MAPMSSTVQVRRYGSMPKRNTSQNPWTVLKQITATAERAEGIMSFPTPLVAHGQSPKLVEPCQGSLDHPAMPAEPFAGADALSGDPI